MAGVAGAPGAGGGGSKGGSTGAMGRTIPSANEVPQHRAHGLLLQDDHLGLGLSATTGTAMDGGGAGRRGAATSRLVTVPMDGTLVVGPWRRHGVVVVTVKRGASRRQGKARPHAHRRQS